MNLFGAWMLKLSVHQKALLKFLKKFAKLIIKNSNVSLIKIENEDSLKKLIKQTGYGEKIYIEI